MPPEPPKGQHLLSANGEHKVSSRGAHGLHISRRTTCPPAAVQAARGKPRFPVLRLHAAGGSVAARLPHLSARPRRLARLHRRRIGRPGIFIGLENYEYLWDDSVFWLSVFNTLLYTVSASILKFVLGLWLALLLNENLPLKSFFRAVMLLPWVVPTVLSAIAFWWIYDSPVLDHLLGADRSSASSTTASISSAIRENARASVIAANVWRGIPFVAITLLAGLQTIPQSLYEAATLDGASRWQLFRYVTLPLLTPIIAITMTFSVLFTFTDFQLIYVLTRGGPVNATHLMATLSFQRGISGGQLGEGAAIAVAMIPFLLAAILFSYFGLQRRKWQQGGGD